MKEKVEEKIITKDDIDNLEETEESTIRRVDNRPGSVFSILIFLMVFLIGYLFYPQLSMYLPIPGEKMHVETRYGRVGIEDLVDRADLIVIAEVTDKDTNAESRTNSNGESIIAKEVKLEVKQVLKGTQESPFVVHELGGNALLNLSGRKKKYNVTYDDAAQYDEDATYLLFLNSDGIVLNGKYGAIKENSDGDFTDIRGTYSVDDVMNLLNGGSEK